MDTKISSLLLTEGCFTNPKILFEINYFCSKNKIKFHAMNLLLTDNMSFMKHTIL